MLRLKATVQQVRTACANDVRKRDVQIQKLKSHLTAQQRGNKAGLVGASITITPGVTGMGANGRGARDDDVLDDQDVEWSLKQETNEMLTQLSQSLGEENSDLTNLVRSTLDTLKELQGISGIQPPVADGVQVQGEANETLGSDMVQTIPTSYDTLAAEMDGTLESLKTLLTNPNFVSIDEVTMREEEIGRLRAGFERLESRWREAIALMNSWRERMANGGDTVNLEELKEGLGLGVGFGASVMIARPAEDPARLSGIAEESTELEEPDFDSAAEDDEPPPPVQSPNVLAIAKSVPNGKDFGDIRLPPIQVPLKEADGNATSPQRENWRATFAEPEDRENGAESNTADQAEDKVVRREISAKPTASRLPRKVGFCDLPCPTPHLNESTNNHTIQACLPTCKVIDTDEVAQTSKRPPSPARHADERSPKLTVQEKLGIAQAEAEAAKVDTEVIPAVNSAVVTTKVKRDPSKKGRVSGRPKRRSTLTRDEMADLLAGLID